MMDGIPVNDITDQLGGTVDLSTIIPFNVARVEVVRGPMSAIYGSEAVAGIVNLVTEDQPKQPWTVRLETGNFGAFEGRMVTGGRRGRLLYSLGIAGTHIGEQVERDSFDAIDSGGRAGVARGSVPSGTGSPATPKRFSRKAYWIAGNGLLLLAFGQTGSRVVLSA